MNKFVKSNMVEVIVEKGGSRHFILTERGKMNFVWVLSFKMNKSQNNNLGNEYRVTSIIAFLTYSLK